VVVALVLAAGCGDTTADNNTDNGTTTNNEENNTQMLSAQMVDCSTATIAQEVSVVDNEFQPANVTISASDVVRWTVDGSNTHTVTSGEAGATDAGALFDSGNIADGATYCVQFDAAGTYDYYCIPHASIGMVGTVEVQE
jgi:plastocyanin